MSFQVLVGSSRKAVNVDSMKIKFLFSLAHAGDSSLAEKAESLSRFCNSLILLGSGFTNYFSV